MICYGNEGVAEATTRRRSGVQIRGSEHEGPNRVLFPERNSGLQRCEALADEVCRLAGGIVQLLYDPLARSSCKGGHLAAVQGLELRKAQARGPDDEDVFPGAARVPAGLAPRRVQVAAELVLVDRQLRGGCGVGACREGRPGLSHELLHACGELVHQQPRTQDRRLGAGAQALLAANARGSAACAGGFSRSGSLRSVWRAALWRQEQLGLLPEDRLDPEVRARLVQGPAQCGLVTREVLRRYQNLDVVH
mmetsp:Transcript_53413/g.147977  ORF Transcript_53413/g.147977 Transcript_53413/m.147977 type:complete len:250 (-) Transcript_53413:130-879(-)